MKVDSLMDLDPGSLSLAHTPAEGLGLPFELYQCGYFLANKQYFTSREGLDNYLLMFTVSGHGLLEYKGTYYDLLAGDAVMIHCLDYQSYGTVDDQWEFYWVHFGGSAVSAYQKIINVSSNSPVRLTEKNGIYLFKEIMGILKSGMKRPDLVICNHLTRILTELASARLSPMNHPSFRRYREEVDDMIDYIKVHLREDITLDELSMETHLSKYYLIRLFKAYTGQTPHEFIIYQRILEAKRLLTTSKLDIANIASATGFYDSNHLIACFKKSTGTTPAQYRKLWLI